MYRLVIFSAGACAGIAVGALSVSGYAALDRGISQSYRCAQLAEESAGRDSAAAVIGQMTQGMTSGELMGTLHAAGLHTETFPKAEGLIIMATPDETGGGLSFLLPTEGGVILSPLPGTPACPRP